MPKVSKLFLDITRSISSSGLQFLITLCTTPIMTRLYDPTAYATFGIINSIAVLFIGIGLLSLQTIYPQEKKPRARRELIHTMLLLLSALVILAVLSAIGMAIADALHIKAHISGLALILLPILVLTYGTRQIFMAVSIERARFGSLSLGQLIEPAFSRGGSIGLGAAIGGHPAFMLLSAALGHLATSATIFKMALGGAFSKWRSLFVRNLKPLVVIRRYQHFVIFNTLSQQAQALALLGIQMGIAAFFSGEEAGHYILALSILTLPGTLIMLATAPAVYRHFSEIERTKSKHLARHVMIAMALYLLAGTVILSPVYFFGEELFSFVFGSTWSQSGAIASTLSLAYVAGFALIGVQSVFLITHRVKLQFVIELCTSGFTLCAALFALRTMDFSTAIRYIALFWMCRNGILLCACGVVAFEQVKKK